MNIWTYNLPHAARKYEIKTLQELVQLIPTTKPGNLTSATLSLQTGTSSDSFFRRAHRKTLTYDSHVSLNRGIVFQHDNNSTGRWPHSVCLWLTLHNDGKPFKCTAIHTNIMRVLLCRYLKKKRSSTSIVAESLQLLAMWLI